MLTYEKLYQEIKNKRKNKKNNIVQKGGSANNRTDIFDEYFKHIPINKKNIFWYIR
tara:strand:+ start:405 stop:572 length:168 start_codon:yes stop_codon:yes gene_type:complete